MTRIALFLIVLTSCTLDEPMEPARTQNPRLAFPDSFDPLDAETPVGQGYVETNAGLPKTEVRAEYLNDVGLEIMSLEVMLGATPIAASNQLALQFEQGIAPPASTLPIVTEITPANSADMTINFASYARAGRVVWVAYNLTWRNGQVGLEGNDLVLAIPFEFIGVSSFNQHGYSIAVSGTDFQADNSTDIYGLTVAAGGALVERATSVGVGFGTVKVGGVVVDANLFRSFRGSFQYKTNGVRNLEWPFVTIRDLPFNPARQAPFTLVYEYDSAKVGDFIEVYKDAVLDQSIAITTDPAGKGSFVANVPGTWNIRLRGVTSNSIDIIL